MKGFWTQEFQLRGTDRPFEISMWQLRGGTLLRQLMKIAPDSQIWQCQMERSLLKTKKELRQAPTMGINRKSGRNMKKKSGEAPDLEQLAQPSRFWMKSKKKALCYLASLNLESGTTYFAKKGLKSERTNNGGSSQTRQLFVAHHVIKLCPVYSTLCCSNACTCDN